MLIAGGAVRLIGAELYGRVRRLAHASQGRCFYQVDWEDGTDTIVPEYALADVEREEYDLALEGLVADRCHSYYFRRCALPAGHRTQRHRCGEISWTDEMADRHAETGGR